MKAVPTRARHPMSNRAERRILLAVVLKAVRQDRHSDSLPSVKAFECYGIVQRSPRPLTPREDRILEDSTLFFSVCVLISGGFMAAAGTRELSLWLRRKALERRITEAERRRLCMLANLDRTELPVLAAALESAGLTFRRDPRRAA